MANQAFEWPKGARLWAIICSIVVPAISAAVSTLMGGFSHVLLLLTVAIGIATIISAWLAAHFDTVQSKVVSGALLVCLVLFLGYAGIFHYQPSTASAQPAVSIKQEAPTTNSPNVVGDRNTINLGVTPTESPLSLEFTCGMDQLPITIEPHKPIYILPLHPKITEDLQTQPAGDKPGRFPADWPKTKREMFKQLARLPDSMIWRCKVTNPNSEALLGIVMTFDEIFREPNATGGSTNKDPIFASHQHPIEVPDLRTGDSFAFYIINESPQFVEVRFPDRAQANVVGRTGQQTIPMIQVGTNVIERMPVWSFYPTHSKWNTVSWGKNESN